MTLSWSLHSARVATRQGRARVQPAGVGLGGHSPPPGFLPGNYLHGHCPPARRSDSGLRRVPLEASAGLRRAGQAGDSPPARRELRSVDAHVLTIGQSEWLPHRRIMSEDDTFRVECVDGSVVLAGQSHDTASGWSADALAASAASMGHAPPLPSTPRWMERLLAFDPKRVVFAHDAAVWEPL